MSASRQAEKAGSLLWAQGLVCGGLAVARPGLAAVAAVLLWPVGLALAIDRQPGKPQARSVALWAAAAAMPALRSAWDAGGALDTVLATLSDFQSVLQVWAAAASGWGISVGAPMAAEAAERALTARRTARLEAERQRLAELWRISAEPPA